jgi:hypothetical protein
LIGYHHHLKNLDKPKKVPSNLNEYLAEGIGDAEGY